jgi:ribosomal protein S3
MQIDGIQFIENKNDVSYVVYLKRPGYMIGAGGKPINEFEKNLSEILDMEVKIRLVEV